jgi:hypothetical protein
MTKQNQLETGKLIDKANFAGEIPEKNNAQKPVGSAIKGDI